MRYGKFGLVVISLVVLYFIVSSLLSCSDNTPTIVNIDPTTASATGGIEITITGTGFHAVPAPTVTIGGNPASGVKVTSKTTIKATIPTGVAGPSEIIVQNAKAKVRSLPFKGFTYYEDVTAISDIPNSATAPSEGIKSPAKIGVVFNQDVDPESVLIKVTGAGGIDFKGTTTQDETNSKMFIFTPKKPLKAGYYDLMVSGAKGIAYGNAMTDYTAPFTVRGKAVKKSSISKSDTIPQRGYIPGFLSPSDNGYAWNQASAEERMSICRNYEYAGMLSRFSPTWYYYALNALYNTSNSGTLNMTIAQATGLVYVGGLHSNLLK